MARLAAASFLVFSLTQTRRPLRSAVEYFRQTRMAPTLPPVIPDGFTFSSNCLCALTKDITVCIYVLLHLICIYTAYNTIALCTEAQVPEASHNRWRRKERSDPSNKHPVCTRYMIQAAAWKSPKSKSSSALPCLVFSTAAGCS